MNNAQKLAKEATHEEKQQFIVDSLFLLAHAQLTVEYLDKISSFKTVWKQVLKRKALTLTEEIEKVLEVMLADTGEGAQEQAFFLINKVKELNTIAAVEFNNTYNKVEEEQ